MTFIYRVRVGLLFFVAYLSQSPVLAFYLGVSNGQLFLLSAALFIVMNLSSIKERLSTFIFLILFLLSIILFVFLSESLLLFNRLIVIPISLCILLCIRRSKTIIGDTVTLASIFGLLAVFCSVIGFFYAFMGGEPTLEILNNDGRKNYLYLTTFSNSITMFFVRPSFIYDEPGALSFMLCSIVFLRVLLGRSKKITILILFGGLITFSLAHIVICVLFILTSAKRGFILFSIIFFTVGVAYTSQMDEFSFFYKRFDVSEGRMAGDNRSQQYSNFIKAINDKNDIYLYGNVSCFESGINDCAKSHGDISSSLVTPIYKAGVLALFYQSLMIFISFFFWLSNKNTTFPLVGIVLLLAQRPLYFDPGYALIIVLVVFAPLILSYHKRFKI